MTDRTQSPAVKRFERISLPEAERQELANGGELTVVSMGSLPMSRVSVMWDGGLADYARGRQAAATLMAVTLPEGTRTMNAERTADLIDFCGARVGGDISAHHTSVETITINSRRGEIFPVIRGIAEEALFDEAAVKAAAGRLASNVAQQQQRVGYAAGKRLQHLLQGLSHPLSVEVSPEEFLVVSRDEIIGVYEEMTRGVPTVFVGGCIDSAMKAEIEQWFGRLKGQPGKAIAVEPFRPETPRREHIAMEESRQSAVAIGMPSISRDHPDYVALRMAVVALGGYFGSRLMKNIREEKGLTYGIRASLCGMHEGAYMEITAQCDALYTDRVIEETIKELERLAIDPPRGEELGRLQLHEWNQLAATTDSAFGVIGYYLTEKKVGMPKDYFSRQIDALSTLKTDDIARVAAEYLRPELLTVITAGQ